MEKAIIKAVEGGYDIQRGRNRDDLIYERLWCDETFWQSLGKALGWGTIDYEDLPKVEYNAALYTFVQQGLNITNGAEVELTDWALQNGLKPKTGQTWIKISSNIKKGHIAVKNVKNKHPSYYWAGFWKEKGKDNTYYNTERNKQWLYHWHSFIDHLAEGKDPEEFFTNLLETK